MLSEHLHLFTCWGKVVPVVQALNEKISLRSGQRNETGPREGIALGTCEAGM